MVKHYYLQVYFFIPGKKWYQQGFSILKKQSANANISADGGHIERSTQYHCLVLEDILDCINMLQASDHEIPSIWQQHV